MLFLLITDKLWGAFTCASELYERTREEKLSEVCLNTFFSANSLSHTFLWKKSLKTRFSSRSPPSSWKTWGKQNKLEWGGPKIKISRLKFFSFFDKEFAGNRAGKKKKEASFLQWNCISSSTPSPGTQDTVSQSNTPGTRGQTLLWRISFVFFFFSFVNLFKNGVGEMFFGKVKREKINGQISLLRGGRGGESECGIGRFLPCTLEYCCIKCSRTSLYLSVL